MPDLRCVIRDATVHMSEVSEDMFVLKYRWLLCFCVTGAKDINVQRHLEMTERERGVCVCVRERESKKGGRERDNNIKNVFNFSLFIRVIFILVLHKIKNSSSKKISELYEIIWYWTLQTKI